MEEVEESQSCLEDGGWVLDVSSPPTTHNDTIRWWQRKRRIQLHWSTVDATIISIDTDPHIDWDAPTTTTTGEEPEESLPQYDYDYDCDCYDTPQPQPCSYSHNQHW